jgi:hypothetical protein
VGVSAHRVRMVSALTNAWRYPRGPSVALVSERVACASLTGAFAAFLVAFGPAPGDAAVHLYRTFLVRHGALLWDNFWYAGHYPLASYSLLYYLPAAVVGNLPLVIAASVVSTLLFASIARREWGSASVWPSRVFAVCAAAPLFTGLYSYSVAFAAMLGVLRALQSRRTALALVLAGLTLGFSPLAFAFLCLILVSILAVRRRVTPSALGLGVGLALLAGFQLVVLWVFPSGGTYPFHAANLVGVLGVSLLGALLARRARNGQILAAFFVLWGASSILLSVVSTPIGDNWTRLDEFAFPLMLLTASLAGFRPRWLVAVALAGAFAYTITPNLMLIPYRLDNRPAAEHFWQPAIQFLQRHAQPGYRVEAVPTAAHWESYWIPRSGFALARGWYRQLDVVDNPALYSTQLGPAAYRHWLRSEAVEYVLLPSTRLDFEAAPREAQLLRSGESGLIVAYRGRGWTIYRLPHPTPLITGPGQAHVLTFGHTRIDGTVSTPGRYLLRAHYIPFWQTSGPVCLRRGPDRMTWLDVTRPGPFSLKVASAGKALLLAADVEHEESCNDAAPARRG